MSRVLRLDFETYSDVPLSGSDSVGVWNYANHPSTQVLMAAYKLPGSPVVQLWEPYLGTMPQILRDTLVDSDVTISAFNSAFERYILQYVLGITIPAKRFIDPQVGARYLSMPGDLDEVSTILGLPEHLAKDKRGETLVKLFCEPQLAKKKRGEFQTYYKADWATHPEEWRAFGEYCKQDVVAEEEVSRRMEILGALPLPPFERKLWEFDQRINDLGIPVDLDFVSKAYKLATRAKQEAKDRQNAITGLENANSVTQLLPWAQERGYPFSTLNKNTVDSVLKDPEVKLSDECRTVLKARREAGSTSYTKLSAIMQRVSKDGRLRGMFVFMGSARCGRWAGSGVQLQNLARPDKVFEEMENVVAAREMVRGERYDEIKARFGSVLLVVKNLIRTVFSCEKTEDKFLVADLASIETRVAAWLANSDDLSKVFRDGKDAYLDLAIKMFGIPYDKLEADYKGKNGKERQIAAKQMRQVAKPGVLGAVYRLGGGGWGFSKDGDKVKTGLFGYADAMGVEMTQEQAQMVVRIFREAYKEIPEFWKILEDAVADVMRGQDTTRRVGPNGCVVIDKINIAGRDSLMRMRLPSGRYLHYIDARLESCKMPWLKDGEEVYRDSLVYAGINQDTKQWDVWVQTHGGKLFENLVQAIARDVLGVKLLAFEEADMPVVGHVHDEGICSVPDDPFSPGVEDMVKIMSTPVDWAPGLLLGADGFESTFYHK